MKMSEIYMEAATLLSDPTKWTAGTDARDKSFAPVSPHSRHAECFCLSGALMKIVGYGREETSIMKRLRQAFKDYACFPGVTPENYNDYAANDHMDVVNKLRKVAAHLESVGE